MLTGCHWSGLELQDEGYQLKLVRLVDEKEDDQEDLSKYRNEGQIWEEMIK